MNSPDIATVQALRQDIALQLMRHVQQQGRSQLSMAKTLGIPQPTLSKIMHGQVTELSLELLIRIAVRARLPLLLQTGCEPVEAGVFVSRGVAPEQMPRSRIADLARDSLAAGAQRLTPAQRLEAHLSHSTLIAALHVAGQVHRAARRAGLSKQPQ